MPEGYNDENRKAAWAGYWGKHANDVLDLANSYPEKKAAPVDWRQLGAHDIDLASDLMEHPLSCMWAATTELKNALPPDMRDSVKTLKFRITGLEKTHQVKEVRQLSQEDIGRMVAVHGIVRKVTQVKPQITEGVFQCARCLAIVREIQVDWDFKTPLECYKDQGGCGKSAASTRFIHLSGDQVFYRGGKEPTKLRSSFVDTQKIEIQECPENLRGGEQPEKMDIYLADDLCRAVTPGDRVTITGILTTRQVKRHGESSTVFNWHLEAYGIKAQDKTGGEVVLADTDLAEIVAFSKNPELYGVLTDSIAPSIYGYDQEKEAMALQLFGGVTKHMPDGTRLRGDIHILLCGDPGTAKSQFLRRMAALSPRGVLASGKATSSAGLTAAAVRDDFGEGRWTLEAGALVLADFGLAAIDELDKMNEADASAMHEGMEQGQVTVSKAGIHATLQSRCSVLAAANPKEGRFQEHEILTDQIELTPTLLSRFDVIFPMVDHINTTWDTNVATHILGSHTHGEQAQAYEAAMAEGRKVPKLEAMVQNSRAVSTEFLRKYIAYARGKVFPVMTPEVQKALRSYYVDIRRSALSAATDGGPTVPMTPRQLEALVRLSEASARARLSNTVKLEDADRARRVVEHFLKLCASEGGRFDIDAIMTGTTHVQRERVHAILDIVQELDEGRGSTEDEVLRRTSELKMDDDKVRRDLARLVNDGRLFQPREGRFKVCH